MVKVLLVDDERDFADVLAMRLASRNMNVRTAYDGWQALEAIKLEAPEVVLLDISMPGMDGLSVLKELKNAHREIEVILLTADTTVATAVTGMKLGAGDYLLKPAELEAVIEAINEARGRRMVGLRRLRMAQTARLAALGELATGVAHEINNPVQIMLNETGWIEELLNESDLSQTTKTEASASLDMIRRQARRCKDITSKLLTLRGALDAQGTVKALGALLDDLLHERQSRLTALGVCVEKCLNAQELPLPVAEWTQVIGNMLDNALDALESVEADAPKTLTIEADVTSEGLRLSIRDSGCGMSAHVQARIFEPFFSTKEVGRGIGLGLAICHGIIEAMEGSISVSSIPGQGSVFTITAPMAVHGRIDNTTPENPVSAKEENG